jgi:hypothetical protein
MGLTEKTSKSESFSNTDWLKRRNAAVPRGIGHVTGIFTECIAGHRI